MDVAKDISNGTAPDVYAMDDGFTDVDVAVSGRDVGASLPTPEEVRGIVNMNKATRSGMSVKTLMLITVAGLVIIASTIGLAVGVSNKNKGGSSSSGNEQPSLGAGLDTAERKSDFGEVSAYFIAAGVSNEVAIKTRGTPQNTAAYWLADNDEANMAVPADLTTTLVGYQYMTRYVLAVLYFAMDGENWNYQADFGTVENICSWNQVNFDGSNFYRQGVLCDSKTGLIFALDLGTWIRNEVMEKMACALVPVDDGNSIENDGIRS
jgi:hypothetical protein